MDEIEIETPPALSYSDTVAIVEAIRTNRLVHHLPPEYAKGGARPPKVDYKSIVRIDANPADKSSWRVYSRTTRVILYVAVEGARVELRGWALMEIA